MHACMRKKEVIIFCAVIITAILGFQLAAITAWTADEANQGPGIVILQFSNDRDTNWAVDDLIDRLSTFISDDPYLPNRIKVIKTNNPYVAEKQDGDIIVYASHGGPLGIVTGRYLTYWETMAEIVENSEAILHLFMACSSKNIIRYGSDESNKKLYTVPGARPAEVTNIEITATIMLALGLDSEYVDEYRTEKLSIAKQMIDEEYPIHIMDFEQIIIDELEYIDDHYTDSYTSTHRVYRYSVEETLSGGTGFGQLPYDLSLAITQYYQVYLDENGIPYSRTLQSCSITYKKNYYYEAIWIPELPKSIDSSIEQDDPPPDPGDPDLFSSIYFSVAAPPSGHWEYGPHIFNGGTYSGLVIFSGDFCMWVQVVVNVTASGPTLDGQGKTEVDAISLKQLDAGGLYVELLKVDDTWQEPVVGRNPYRTGGLWIDPAVKADYEYDSSWPSAKVTVSSAVKEDAEDGDTYDWGVYDSSPPGTITNVYIDGDRAIRLQGGGTSTGYKYPYSSSHYWNDATHKVIRWSMKYSESYTVYISVDTTSGHRYIYYTPVNYNNLGTGEYVHYGLGSYTKDGGWRTFERDLEADLHQAQPNVDIIDVNAFLIRGSGYVDDIILLKYADEASGSISSNGEYITISSIPTGSSWHGPSFISTLPSYFRLRDFGSFSANLSLVHNGNGYRISATYVNLYDENKRIVVSLGIRDAWTYSGSDAQKQRLYANFYKENGEYESYYTDLKYGDYCGVVQIRYDPMIGIFADVPDKDEEFLYAHNRINENRLIKYIAIQSYRYSDKPEHDERIYNIRLSYAGSDYTVFHDQCNDMDEFRKDLDFGYGTSGDGTLEAYPEESYMEWDSIASGSGWHGPNYVHVLDRPFRLYQLADFSVIGELVQSSSTMGKTYVGLFDENKNCVVLVYWGDSWVGSKKAYFNLAFYPQNGGSYYQQSGYIYNQGFTKTGKLWWEEFQGGNGAIYSSIDGQGDAYPLGECDNASRVIKYVVILGYRYSSYNLVDMRIHDINVVADLTRSKPQGAPPVEDGDADGTEQTYSPTILQIVDQLLIEAISNVIVYWTGWWPRLHIVISSTTVFHMSVDLLGTTELYDSSSEGANEEDFNNALLVAEFSAVNGLWMVALIMACAAAEKMPTGWWGIAGIILTMFATAAFAWYMSHQMVDNGQWTAGAASVYFIVLSISYFGIAAGLKKIGGISANVIIRFLAWCLGETAEAILAAVQFTNWSRLVFVIMGFLFLMYAGHFYLY